MLFFFSSFFFNWSCAVLIRLNLQDPVTSGTLGYDLLLLLLCSEDTPRECAKSLDFAKKQFSFKWSFHRSELCKSSYTLNHLSEWSTYLGSNFSFSHGNISRKIDKSKCKISQKTLLATLNFDLYEFLQSTCWRLLKCAKSIKWQKWQF